MIHERVPWHPPFRFGYLDDEVWALVAENERAIESLRRIKLAGFEVFLSSVRANLRGSIRVVWSLAAFREGDSTRPSRHGYVKRYANAGLAPSAFAKLAERMADWCEDQTRWASD